MRLRRNQRPAAAGPPLATIFGIVGIVASALGAIWIGMGFPRPFCRFRELSGLPCPTCGTTRLAEALLGGDLVGAFALNPLVFLSLAALGAWAVASTVQWLRRAPTTQFVFDRGERLALRLGGVAVLTGGWIYLIVSGV